ncbi:hypothetical protein SODALDRAFT_328427 [Sodiomyces alkalinus F11]|uniref:J domain-containing protein n=1 Tax=Sodiomyces alkalinus (strain CBS 110278 / VKM F-3762 / F11) TaxID=1314773 RepID=A0A3N2PNF1_SODAK|nr:hypothetical protein SODALDRAFT_328427 [Sodiomyces alkalinus F11]ROT36045.1 hypothetical protein SODALDRAFT_328427 [Sodiomyces alkalinus F11]
MEAKELLTKASDLASRNIDLYALVGLDENDDATASLDAKAVHRAWRKASLKHHPDKAGTAFDPDKWDLLETARDVLLDTSARGAYDAARRAQRLRAQERSKVEGHRKRLIDELEAAENEAKRRRAEERERAAQLEREKARLAEEGRRRMVEEAERFKREQLERMAREQAREEDKDEDDDRLRELQALLDEVRRRKAEKKARRRAGKAGYYKNGVGESEESKRGSGEDEAKQQQQQQQQPTTAPASAPAGPPRWEDLKARMIAVQRRRDAEKLAKQQAQAQAQGQQEQAPTQGEAPPRSTQTQPTEVEMKDG